MNNHFESNKDAAIYEKSDSGYKSKGSMMKTQKYTLPDTQNVPEPKEGEIWSPAITDQFQKFLEGTTLSSK